MNDCVKGCIYVCKFVCLYYAVIWIGCCWIKFIFCVFFLWKKNEDWAGSIAQACQKMTTLWTLNIDHEMTVKNNHKVYLRENYKLTAIEGQMKRPARNKQRIAFPILALGYLDLKCTFYEGKKESRMPIEILNYESLKETFREWALWQNAGQFIQSLLISSQLDMHLPQNTSCVMLNKYSKITKHEHLTKVISSIYMIKSSANFIINVDVNVYVNLSLIWLMLMFSVSCEGGTGRYVVRFGRCIHEIRKTGRIAWAKFIFIS